MNKKGQIGLGIPDIISILFFIALAALVFGLLTFADSATKQEIIDGLEDTTVGESLIVYLKMPVSDFSNVADEIVKSRDTNDFSELNEFTLKNLDTSSEWIIFVLDREDKKLNDVRSSGFNTLKFIFTPPEKKTRAEQFIPDESGKVLKVIMYKFKEGEL